MSSIKRVFLTFFACLILLFSFVFPAFAQPVDKTFTFNIPEPMANGCDGYIVIPWRYSSTNLRAQCFYWDIDIVYSSNTVKPDSNSVISTNEITTAVTLSNNRFNVIIGTGSQNVSAIVSLYSIWDGDNSTIQRVKSYVVDYSSSVNYTVNFDTSSYPSGELLSTGYFGGFSNFTNTAQSGAFTFDCVWSNQNATFNELQNINTHFVSMLSKMDFTNEQLAEAVSKLNDIFDTVSSIDGALADFIYYYWEQFTYYQLPEQFNAVTSRLDTIIRLLNKKGETEQTTVDSSKVDEYLDIEQSLVNNDEAQSALNEFDISIDGQSYNFIWTLITDILNSHPEVFGLIITILTLGFLALILNR